LVKTRPILILFTLFRIYIKNATSFIKGKKFSKVSEANDHQINGNIFAVKGLSPCLEAFPPPPSATQPPHLNVSENAGAVRDEIYIQ
jgi:hypothetical protein